MNRFSQPFYERFLVSSFLAVLESNIQTRKLNFNLTLSYLTIEGNNEVTLALVDYRVKRSWSPSLKAPMSWRNSNIFVKKK